MSSIAGSTGVLKMQRTTTYNPSGEVSLPAKLNSMSLQSRESKAGTILTASTEDQQTISYIADRVIGTGSFGVVFQATIVDSGETVAIKKVLQDKRFKNRELAIMRQISHPNIVRLMHCFYSNGDKVDEVYLNLVLEYVPDTLYRIVRNYAKMKQTLPLIYVKVFAYQLLRGLGYMHSVGICHRDIKPQNLLVDRQAALLKICDFGSAKQLVKGEPNVSYISSRYYRAPELMFGATLYTTAIDVWSAGCVIAEMMIGQPLFPGGSGVDQIVEIIKILGTPTKDEIYSMNESYKEFKFPNIEKQSWRKVFRSTTPPEAIDFVSSLLQYTPTMRPGATRALAHPFLDELRDPRTRLPNGNPLPDLFNFSEKELAMAGSDVRDRLIPSYLRR